MRVARPPTSPCIRRGYGGPIRRRRDQGQVSLLVLAVLATVPSYVLARRLERKTVYTLRLEAIDEIKERSAHMGALRHRQNLSPLD